MSGSSSCQKILARNLPCAKMVAGLEFDFSTAVSHCRLDTLFDQDD